MSFWDDTKTDQLRDCHARGLGPAAIMSEIGAPTRNTVIGKLNRLGLMRRGGNGGPAQREGGRQTAALLKARAKRAKPAPAPKPVVFRSTLPEAPTPLPIDTRVGRFTFETLPDDGCKWPLGDPRHINFGFCGEPRLPGRPYCPDCTSRSKRAA